MVSGRSTGQWASTRPDRSPGGRDLVEVLGESRGGPAESHPGRGEQPSLWNTLRPVKNCAPSPPGEGPTWPPMEASGWRNECLESFGGGAVVVAATTALLVPGATPAHASAPLVVTPTASPCGWHNQLTCVGEGQGALVGLSSETVTYSCQAVGNTGMDRVAVGCYLLGADNVKYGATVSRYFPGFVAPALATASLPVQGYSICVGAGFSTAAGDFQPVQNYSCG